MDEQMLDDQLEPTYNSSVPIRDVNLKSNWKQWIIGRGGERVSGIFMLIERRDNDDDDSVSSSSPTEHQKEEKMSFSNLSK